MEEAEEAKLKQIVANEKKRLTVEHLQGFEELQFRMSGKLSDKPKLDVSINSEMGYKSLQSSLLKQTTYSEANTPFFDLSET